MLAGRRLDRKDLGMVDEVYRARRGSAASASDVISGPDYIVRQGTFRRISWGGVFAGLFLVLAIELLLSMLGFGIGLSMVQPGQGGAPNAGTIGIDAVAWWFGTYIIALVIGSYAAARLAGVVLRSDGALHGLVTWAFALIVTLYLLTTAVGGLIAGAFGVVGNALSVAEQNLKTAVPELGVAAGIPTDQIQQRAKELLQPTQPSQMSNEQAEAQLTKDVGIYFAGGNGAQQARDQIVDIMAAKLGISRDDAARRFDQWASQFNQAKSNIGQGARQVANEAAGLVSRASLWGFGALSLGAIFSCIGGAVGTQPRRLAREARLR
jgi:hypothetical protein